MLADEEIYFNIPRYASKMMQLLPTILICLDKNGTISFVNSKFLKVTGYAEDELLGYKFPGSFVLRDYSSEIFYSLEKLLSGKITSIDGLEITLFTKKNQNVNLMVNAVPFTENGVTKGFFISGMETSTLKETVKYPGESELLLKKVLELYPLSIALLDQDLIPVYLNRKFIESFGYTLDEARSMRSWWGFAHTGHGNNQGSTKRSSSFDLVSGGNTKILFNSECSLQCKDGSLRDIEFNIARINDERYILILKDVTEIKNAQKALLLDEQRLEALVELNQFTGSTIDDVIYFSLEKAVELTGSQVGYIGFVNEDDATVDMFACSYKAKEMCMINHRPRIYNLDDMGLWGEPIRQRKPHITNDYPVDEPYCKGMPKGHVKLANHLGIPVFDDYSVVMVAGVANKDCNYDSSDIRQITLLMEGTWNIIQKKQSEEKIKAYANELASNNKELESLDRMKDEFMTNITHELKTPLIPIKGYSELLFEGHIGTLEDEQIRCVQIILRSAERLHKMIDSLLYMQNIRSGNIQYHLDSIDICNLLDKVIREISNSRNDRVPSLKKDYDYSFPFVCGNITYLEQVFFHILENAFKFTSQDGEVAVSVRHEKNKIHITVKDTGIGIPKAELKNVFKRFYQADGSLTRRYGGNGLGLYLCKSIVEAHGGSIWAVSEEGKGTELHVILPRIKKLNV